MYRDVSIHAPRVGCDSRCNALLHWCRVSIHAPRVGCDGELLRVAVDGVLFQFTHPAWGATCCSPSCGSPPARFQFTHPAWGATELREAFCATHAEFQFTHPAWGATILKFTLTHLTESFNSRTPRGVRLSNDLEKITPMSFQFTHPAWGATYCSIKCFLEDLVSIHAPRVGCDSFIHAAISEMMSFNSRTPRGVRLIRSALALNITMFQFTHPAWGATAAIYPLPPKCFCFNSRTPRGVRLADGVSVCFGEGVSIHAPRVGCDDRFRVFSVRTLVSIHAPRVGCDGAADCGKGGAVLVSIHAPRVGCDRRSSR